MARKYYDVLVQKNGRIEWMSVPGCNTHAEARAQGNQMYDGKILQTRFNGVDNGSTSSSSDSSTFGGLALLAVGAGILLLISMWPIFLIGGIVYGLYKIFKK